MAVDRRVIYVADRTNVRIQRFDLDERFLGEWTHVGRPYALKLAKGALWISGTTLDTPRGVPIVLKVETSSGKIRLRRRHRPSDVFLVPTNALNPILFISVGQPWR